MVFGPAVSARLRLPLVLLPLFYRCVTQPWSALGSMQEDLDFVAVLIGDEGHLLSVSEFLPPACSLGETAATLGFATAF